MRLILLGAPGAGKGTQAQFICEQYHIPKIGTGDMLREEIALGTPIGHNVKNIIAEGKLVPEEIVNELLMKRLKAPDCQSGFLLDGYPRTISQAETLIKAHISIDAVIEIHVSDDIIIERLSGRRIHPQSGRIYHILYNPPREEGKDDITQEPLIQRDDDKEVTIRKRLEVYHQQTEPLIEWYQKQGLHFIRINGSDTVNAIKDKIRQELMPPQIQTLTKSNFDQIITSNDLVLVDFWAAWCGPCRSFAEIYQAAAEKYPEVIFGKVDIENEPELADDFQVRSIPRLMVFRGNIAVFAESGAMTLEALEKIITEAKALDITALQTLQQSVESPNSDE